MPTTSSPQPNHSPAFRPRGDGPELGARIDQFTPFRTVVVAVRPGEQTDDQTLETRVAAAAVLVNWTGTTLQVVASDPAGLEVAATTTQARGVPTAPPRMSHITGLEDQIERPVLVVDTLDDEGLAAERDSPYTTLLVPPGSRRWVPGPLVLPLSLHDADDVAELTAPVAAVWALALDVPIRVALDADDGTDDDRGRTVARNLRQLGVRVVIEEHVSTDLHAIEMWGGRGAMAMVVPSGPLVDGPLGERALGSDTALLCTGGETPTHDEPDDRHDGTDERTSLDRLAAADLGRLAYVVDGRPTIVPVQFAVVDRDLVIRSLPGTKATLAGLGVPVCLEVDEFDPDRRRGWSVVAHGTLEPIADPAVMRRAWTHDPSPWIASDRWTWLRLRIRALTSRDVG